MQMTIKKQIGVQPYEFTVEGRNLHELVMEAEKLAFPNVEKCGLCDSTSLRLTAYVTEDGGYKYVKVVCNKCRGSVTFGQPKKSPDTFYLRRKEDSREYAWEAYVPKTEAPAK
jgi:hypothetical protein